MADEEGREEEDGSIRKIRSTTTTLRGDVDRLKNEMKEIRGDIFQYVSPWELILFKQSGERTHHLIDNGRFGFVELFRPDEEEN